ncbi:ERF family protein [Levilactobacillus brevis]|uniref:ERF family protein n=1 Tax=Levilactobacillus brevis TaxID=1580 RepID=UPI001BADB633|nr:ERF family protein [Levilactobacillus brevis]MBS1006897.1 ERF family protein [Levilactobacillus brevis]
MEKSESIKNLATSMAQFRKNLLKAQPSKDGKSHYGNYVTLEDLTAAVDGALPESLGYTQEATSDPNGVSITTMLFDASGEYIIYNPLSMPVQRKDAQAFGSAETYARRYSLSAAFGVSASKDDDGQQATKAAPSKTQNGTKRPADRVTTDQMTELTKLFKQTSEVTNGSLANVQKYYLGQFNVSNISQLTKLQADEIITVVKRKLNGGNKQ